MPQTIVWTILVTFKYQPLWLTSHLLQHYSHVEVRAKRRIFQTNQFLYSRQGGSPPPILFGAVFLLLCIIISLRLIVLHDSRSSSFAASALRPHSPVSLSLQAFLSPHTVSFSLLIMQERSKNRESGINYWLLTLFSFITRSLFEEPDFLSKSARGRFGVFSFQSRPRQRRMCLPNCLVQFGTLESQTWNVSATAANNGAPTGGSPPAKSAPEKPTRSMCSCIYDDRWDFN